MECPICGNNFSGSTCNECGHGKSEVTIKKSNIDNNKITDIKFINIDVSKPIQNVDRISIDISITLETSTLTGVSKRDETIDIFWDTLKVGEGKPDEYGRVKIINKNIGIQEGHLNSRQNIEAKLLNSQLTKTSYFRIETTKKLEEEYENQENIHSLMVALSVLVLIASYIFYFTQGISGLTGFFVASLPFLILFSFGNDGGRGILYIATIVAIVIDAVKIYNLLWT